MGLIDAAKRFLTLDMQMPPPQTRAIDSFTDHPGLTQQLLAIQGLTARPWRAAGVPDALGVPAIHRAVTLIANTGAAMNVEAYRRGVRLAPDDRPRLIVRPDPFRIPRDFYRDTIFSMATTGEAWWWVAKRDPDGNPMSLLLMPTGQISVTEDPQDLRYPIIEWRGRRLPNRDVRQITLLRSPGELRGFGPLQRCAPSVSIAVEAQEWAANFYAAGGYPNIWIKAAGDLSGGLQGDPDEDEEEVWLSEIQRLKAQWIETAPNTPKITDESIEDIKQFDPNPQGAQMLEARRHQTGEAAQMFGIPGAFMEWSEGGSNLTYQNLAEVKTNYLELCLIPNYLEPIEQTMSDLLTNSTTMKFDADSFLRADIRTRYDVYASGIASGILTPELAQSMEGITPGSVELAPVPLAAPSAIPSRLPISEQRAAMVEIRCDGMAQKRRSGVTRIEKCGRLLSKTGSFVGRCPRCDKDYAAA
jgi:HK97 family phage portal protein